MYELKYWQIPVKEQIVERIGNGRIFICGATTGSGKTFMSLAAVKELGMQTLVICPKQAKAQWKILAEDFDCRDQIFDIINPEQISKPTGCSYYTRQDGWQLPDNCLVICDEFHRYGCSNDANSPTLSVISKALISLYDSTNAKLLALSATIADTPFKFRVLGHWLGWFSKRWQFINWLFSHSCYEVIHDHYGSAIEFWLPEAKTCMAKIRNELGNNFISLSPDDIPDYPAESSEVKYVLLDGKRQRDLETAYAEMPHGSHLTLQDLTQRESARKKAETCKATILAELTKEAVQAGQSVFVAVNYRCTVEIFHAELNRLKIPCVEVVGGQSESERAKAIALFQSNEVHVLVATTPAGGTALSLHDVHHKRPRLSLISPGYSAQDLIQAMGRTRRVGGTPSHVEIVIAANTVEEKVGRRLNYKLSALKTFNGTISDSDLRRE